MEPSGGWYSHPGNSRAPCAGSGQTPALSTLRQSPGLAMESTGG